MKKFIYIICILLSTSALRAQTDSIRVKQKVVMTAGIPILVEKTSTVVLFPVRKNSVYAEFLGNGFAYSLNYERLIYSDENLGISTRIGIAPGFVPLFTGFGLPLEANFTFLRNRGHMAEVGPGFTWFYGKSRYRNEKRELVTTSFYHVCDVTLRIGYKYVAKSGFLFRAAFIPTFAVTSPKEVRENSFFPMGKTFTPWAGISVGYAFR
jgi:hypothetical protein